MRATMPRFFSRVPGIQSQVLVTGAIFLGLLHTQDTLYPGGLLSFCFYFAFLFVGGIHSIVASHKSNRCFATKLHSQAHFPF